MIASSVGQRHPPKWGDRDGGQGVTEANELTKAIHDRMPVI